MCISTLNYIQCWITIVYTRDAQLLWGIVLYCKSRGPLHVCCAPLVYTVLSHNTRCNLALSNCRLESAMLSLVYSSPWATFQKVITSTQPRRTTKWVSRFNVCHYRFMFVRNLQPSTLVNMEQFPAELRSFHIQTLTGWSLMWAHVTLSHGATWRRAI